MTLPIPPNDAGDFANLSDECRAEIRQWLRAFHGLVHLPDKAKIGDALSRVAAQLCVSTKTARRKWDAFRETISTERPMGDFRVLINRAKYPATVETLPADFIAFWKKLCESNQRKCKPAWRQLIRGWKKQLYVLRDGKILTECPGYSDWPAADPVTGIPEGWSYRNLVRPENKPSRAELTAMRQGLGAAIAKHVGKINTTRADLWVMSHISIDDVKRDVKGLLITKNQTVCIQELGILELSASDRFMVHRRPQYIENGTKNSIKERETRFLLASWARNVGFSPKGTEIIAELGTAAVRVPLAEFFAEHSGERISVRRAGITGREQAIAGYWGRGGGNPRHKPAHEAHHNLLHNESGDLPAQTGHGRNPPEWLFGLEAVTAGVCKQLATLPPERAGLLIAPMAEYWQLLSLLFEIDQMIAHRTDHELEGWHECGNTITEFREDPTRDEWIALPDFLALPQGRQQLIASAALADPRYRRARKLSPREVLLKGTADLIRFPDHVIALMFADKSLGDDLRENRRVTSEGEFEISNQLAEPEPMLFLGTVTDSAGASVTLREGELYGTVLNPWDTSALWVYDGRGGFIGTAKRKPRLSRLNDAGEICKPGELSTAMKHALGNRESQIAALVAPLRERHADVVAQIHELQEHNARVINGDAVTIEEKAQERADRKRVVNANQFLSDSSGDDAPEEETLVAINDEGFAEKQRPLASAADFLE
jgi:hypothetical protein